MPPGRRGADRETLPVNASSRPSSRTDDKPLPIRSVWMNGPRTAAWDHLWRTILADIGVIPTTDSRETLESEVGDA